MSPILIGGDGSIQWEVDVKRGKAGKITSDREIGPGHSHPGGRFKSEGKADTDPEAPQRFEITIKHPKDAAERNNFLLQLNNAFTTGTAGATTATFSIPIEDDNHKLGKTDDQIVVKFPE